MRNAFNLPSSWIHYNRMVNRNNSRIAGLLSATVASRRLIFRSTDFFPHSLRIGGIADGAICRVPRSLRNGYSFAPPKRGKFVSKLRFFATLPSLRTTYSFACCGVVSFSEEEDILFVT